MVANNFFTLKDRTDLSVFGLELQSGGSLKQAFTDTLKESAMYKNVVKESITFMIKLTAWTLMNFFLYQGAIFNASALQRSFSKDFGRSLKSSDMDHIKNILKVGVKQEAFLSKILLCRIRVLIPKR